MQNWRYWNQLKSEPIPLILEPLIAAKAKERQATSTGGASPQLRENSREAEKGRTDESLAQIAGIGDIEDGPDLDQPPEIFGGPGFFRAADSADFLGGPKCPISSLSFLCHLLFRGLQISLFSRFVLASVAIFAVSSRLLF